MEDEPSELEQQPEGTLQLLFDLVRQSPDADLRAVDAMDGKIVQVFTAGAMLLGLPAAGDLDTTCWFIVPLVVATAAFSYLAYQTRADGQSTMSTFSTSDSFSTTLSWHWASKPLRSRSP